MRRHLFPLLTTALFLAATASPLAGQGPGGPGGPGGGPGMGVGGPGVGAGGRQRPGGYDASSVGEASFQIDPKTGSLIVITDEQTNEYIRAVIQNLDQPVPQVLIKVLFLEVTHGDDLDLGTEFTYHSGRTTRVDQYGNPIVDSAGVEQTTWRSTAQTLFGVAAQTDGAFYRLLTDDLEMTLRGLATVAKLEVLSRPSILARNNEQAIITLGNEVPFITNSRVTQDGQIINTVEYRDIGIILNVTPRITRSGLVEMYVAPEISTLSGDTVKISETIEAPIIAKRAAETVVMVPDGMTVVIGGLMEDSKTDAVRKVPILGSIPWVGTAFRRTVKSNAKTELLIFLTPHVVQTTTSLQAMSVRESAKATMAPVAFTPPQLDKHLDGYERLILPPLPEAKRENAILRAARWVWDEVQIFK